MKAFGLAEREQLITEAKETTFDLIVIGGGITGAGILLDAVSRGMRCLLLEKRDFASGTSSRSTKLIHGGLRYLKQLEFGLVRETGTERAVAYRNAPHVVRPENMLLPIYKDGSLGEWTTSLGLKVYDFLADVESSEKRKMLSADDVMKREPLLKTEALTGGGIYKEYRTDDARLVIEILKKAVYYNAGALNYASVDSFIYNEEKVSGLKVIDHLSGEQFELTARTFINATGPWVDKLRSKDETVEGKRLKLTKGVHIVVPYEKLPIKQSVYFDVPDGRMMFAIPRDGITYIGTTDTFYENDPVEPGITMADVDYVLDGANTIFPEANIKADDIVSSWSGVRPLIHEDGKAPSELSRKDEIFISDSGLISIAGGKLTGYRKMAERAVDKAVASLAKNFQLIFDQDCITDQLKLAGGDFKHPKDIHVLNAQLQLDYQDKLDNALIHRLVFRYGSNAAHILEEIVKDKQSPVICELAYCFEYESVACAADFFIRRTGDLYFNRSLVEKEKDEVEQWLNKAIKGLGRSANNEEEDLMASFERVLDFS